MAPNLESWRSNASNGGSYVPYLLASKAQSRDLVLGIGIGISLRGPGDERHHRHLHRRNLHERYPFLNHSSCPRCFPGSQYSRGLSRADAEQVTITKPVTIEGIAASNGALAQIILPIGYTQNATLTDADGNLIAAVAQVYVHNVSGGSVNLSNLQVNGMGFGDDADFFVGIFYEGSSGTINQVITTSQNDNSGSSVTGFGMWIQGGSSKPSVTVENSSMHDFTQCGIYAVGTTTAPDLTVTIKNNNISSVRPRSSPTTRLWRRERIPRSAAMS